MINQASALSQTRLAILGLGLMGGSLGLALRGRCAALFGIDPDPAARKLALERQVVQHVAGEAAEVIPLVDMLVLAAPVSAILESLEQLPVWFSSGLTYPDSLVVLDLGSTKSDICAAMQALPAGFDPIGGHPMCGKEKATLAFAEPTLYQGAPFALVPLGQTSPRARNLASELVEAIGARPLWVDAATHDAWTAATSHLPYLLASTLAGVTPPQAAPLVGPGWRSTARLAGSSLPMMLDILRTNRENVLPGLRGYTAHLARLEKWLADEDWTAITAWMQSNQAAYRLMLTRLEGE